MSDISPINFTSVADDLVGRRNEHGYRLVDNEGGVWEYVLDGEASIRFLAFIKVPKKYKPLLGVSTAISMFNSIEKEAFKAIDHYNLTKGLKKGAKEAWSDILEFKQYHKIIEEEESKNKPVVIRDFTDRDLLLILKLEGKINNESYKHLTGWVMKWHGEEYYICIEYPNEHFANQYLVYKRSITGTLGFSFSCYYTTKTGKEITEAIEYWKLINGLKGDAKEAWRDILESKASNYSIVDKMTERQLNIIKKNYPLQWGNGYVINYTYSKLRGTEYGNSKYYAVKILNAVNPECYIGLFSNKYAFRTYYSKDSDIGKLVDHYELTNNLKKGAKEAWSDILEFKDYFQG